MQKLEHEIARKRVCTIFRADSFAREFMFKLLHADSLSQLIDETIPKQIHLKDEMNLPSSLSESRFIEFIKRKLMKQMLVFGQKTYTKYLFIIVLLCLKKKKAKYLLFKSDNI